MGLFGKKKKEENTVQGETQTSSNDGPIIEPISRTSAELKDLLNEFNELKQNSEAQYVDDSIEEIEEVEEEVEESHEGQDEYEVSEQESESIESYLSGEEEIAEEEVIEEEEFVDEDGDAVEVDAKIIEPEDELIAEEEVIEEDSDVYEESNSEEEIVDEMPYEESVEELDELPEEVVEESLEVDDSEIVEDEDESISEDIIEEEAFEENPEEAEDYSYENEEELSEETEEPEEIEEPIVVEKPKKATKKSSKSSSSTKNKKATKTDNFVTGEEIDKKFEDFEKRLLDTLMSQLAKMQPVVQASTAVQNAPAQVPVDEEINIQTVNGKLVINGYEFSGEVVMFTPITSLKQASWEEVVRRKGHCTYHLTTSGNGGWFIKKSNAPNPYAYIEKKEEAEELAKFYAQREKAELKIHNSKGVIEKSLSYGREKLRG